MKSFRTSKRGHCAGYLIAEVLLYAVLLVGVMAALGVFLVSFRALVSFSGAETLGGRTIALNPDESTLGRSHVLNSETQSMAGTASFVIATSKAWSVASLASGSRTLPVGDLSSDELSNPDSVAAALIGAGVDMEPGFGFSVLLVDDNLRAGGVVSVFAHQENSASMEQFTVYEVHLFGMIDGLWGELYSYEFASPSLISQSIVQPSYKDGLWTITMPDPSAPTTYPSGALVTTVESKIIYALPSKL